MGGRKEDGGGKAGKAWEQRGGDGRGWKQGKEGRGVHFPAQGEQAHRKPVFSESRDTSRDHDV